MRRKLVSRVGRLPLFAVFTILFVCQPQIAFSQSGVPRQPITRPESPVVSDTNLSVPQREVRDSKSNSILLKKIEPLLLFLLGLFLFLAATGIKQRQLRAGSVTRQQFTALAATPATTLASRSSGQPGTRPIV